MSVTAPFTDEQVDALNYYQRSGIFHPFTCPHRSEPGHDPNNPIDLGALVATPDGWVCEGCDYTQNWAHAEMADREVLEEMRKSMPWLPADSNTDVEGDTR